MIYKWANYSDKRHYSGGFKNGSSQLCDVWQKCDIVTNRPIYRTLTQWSKPIPYLDTKEDETKSKESSQSP